LLFVDKSGFPLFRIFNIWTQTKKYDPDCAYIKKWIPELRSVSNKDILDWDTRYKKHQGVYVAPIVDHAASAKQAKSMLKRENTIDNFFAVKKEVVDDDNGEEDE
jgi:deoxyribodipyrimidine photolyase